jgi:hypothetical protein
MSDVKEFLAEQMRDPEFAEAYKAADIEVEHQRLQSAVVAKARTFGAAWKAHLQDRISSRHPSEQLDAVATEARIQLCDSVGDLIAYEQQHNMGS